ncbi:hypothetical protein D3C71_2138610 [compost metagenome]
MQDAIGGDGTHLCDEYPKNGFNRGGKRNEKIVIRVGCVAGLMRVGRRHDIAFCIAHRLAVGDACHFHVAKKWNRILKSRLVGNE